MAVITRRRFLEKTPATTAVARFLDETLAQLEANPPGYPIGSQIYPHRQLLRDFPAMSRPWPRSESRGSSSVRHLVTGQTSLP